MSTVDIIPKPMVHIPRELEILIQSRVQHQVEDLIRWTIRYSVRWDIDMGHLSYSRGK